MKIEVKGIYPVFAWKWDIPNDNHFIQNKERELGIDYSSGHNMVDEDEDVCGICRFNYNRTCPNCKVPGKRCPLVVGNCFHNFHVHCIYKWLDTTTSKGLCPMCRQEFKLKEGVALNKSQEDVFKSLELKQARQRFGAFDEDVDVDLSGFINEEDYGVVGEREVGQGANGSNDGGLAQDPTMVVR
ncbi:hypothetical protein TBLA_0A00260 [Henningerozyma blattae CBS 6284]|uniref:Anaphase-promoting complex subunit 11 n=1 Tax=Henningerozyma blattae (strain ATCC 34711 / CBS 6284 / DSM 70876 / NBRC 10599 / NRRL Y-10934 / UCD 77-7) TaxID=1071380 RepID=I2GUM5_HENB6|nr:hypothetical protein TBLA_0A00260 [Tetrapisispora blattae CBS 6284]CCH57827.1 hypothetical protein TBLA_0A00260 [Tetrapisispora blattae CBS 6284]